LSRATSPNLRLHRSCEEFLTDCGLKPAAKSCGWSLRSGPHPSPLPKGEGVNLYHYPDARRALSNFLRVSDPSRSQAASNRRDADDRNHKRDLPRARRLALGLALTAAPQLIV